MRIALATAPGAADISKDDAILKAALENLGASVENPVWFEEFDWASCDVVAVRTTWDYQFRLSEFRAWIDMVSERTRLVNPAPILHGNMHKSYLLDLEAKGVPVVPTRVLAGESDVEALMPSNAFLDELDWVVKPEVGASAGDTFRSRDLGNVGIRDHLFEAVKKGKVLVQDYQESIETEGEFSLIWIDGEITHAIQKTPAAGDFRVQVEHGGANRRIEIPTDGRKIAQACIAALPLEPVFARVDLVRDPVGRLRLMEMELIEPELMFEWAPEAADRLARALVSPSSNPGGGGG